MSAYLFSCFGSSVACVLSVVSYSVDVFSQYICLESAVGTKLFCLQELLLSLTALSCRRDWSHDRSAIVRDVRSRCV